MAKERIELTMSFADAVYAISEGNPGAITVCMQILQQGQAIDPDNALGGFGTILDLDTLGIYGSRVWMLFKDVCDQHIGKMIAVLRANQLGFLSAEDLNRAIDNRGDGIDVEALIAAVQERLPAFSLDPNDM